jgi:mevalonate kinase
VVSGGKALAASVGLYSEVEAVADPSSSSVVVASEKLGLVEDLSECRHMCQLRRVVEYIQETYGVEMMPARVTIRSQIPLGSGLGSSASVAVAFAAAYSCLLGLDLSAREVSQVAFEAEKVVHGKPSGIDNTVVSHGGFLIYRRGFPVEFIGTRVPRVDILIVDSGVKRSTKVAVEAFQQRLARLGRLGRALFDVQEVLVSEAIDALARSDVKRLGELMDVAQGLLNAMGVSHPEIEKILHVARAAGAYGGKLSGAGLGGIAIVVADRANIDAVMSRVAEMGYSVYRAPLGVEGVRVAVRA